MVSVGLGVGLLLRKTQNEHFSSLPASLSLNTLETALCESGCLATQKYIRPNTSRLAVFLEFGQLYFSKMIECISPSEQRRTQKCSP